LRFWEATPRRPELAVADPLELSLDRAAQPDLLVARTDHDRDCVTVDAAEDGLLAEHLARCLGRQVADPRRAGIREAHVGWPGFRRLRSDPVDQLTRRVVGKLEAPVGEYRDQMLGHGGIRSADF